MVPVRLWRAIAVLPKTFAKKVDSIKGGLAQVNAESSVLLDERVGEIKAELEGKLALARCLAYTANRGLCSGRYYHR
jgi:hypothetical protein